MLSQERHEPRLNSKRGKDSHPSSPHPHIFNFQSSKVRKIKKTKSKRKKREKEKGTHQVVFGMYFTEILDIIQDQKEKIGRENYT